MSPSDPNDERALRLCELDVGGSKHWLWKSQASRMVYLRLTKPKRNMLVALCLTSFGHIHFKSRGCQLRIKLFNQLRLTVCCFAERNQSAISGAWHKVHQIVAKTWKSCVLVRDLNKCLASIYSVKSPTNSNLTRLTPLSMKLVWRDTKRASKWLNKPPKPGIRNIPIPVPKIVSPPTSPSYQ